MKPDQSDLQDEEQKPTGESFENDPLYGSTVGYQEVESKRRSDLEKWAKNQGAQKHLSTVIRVCETS
jgi:hypothetical protein